MVLLDSYTGNVAIISLTRLHPSVDAAKASAIGQVFDPNALVDVGNYKLTRCKFYLTKGGSPTGIGNARLYAKTGIYGFNGTPTGSPLAISDGIDVSNLPSGWNEFLFTGNQQYVLQAGVKYAIGFFNPESGTINDSNYIRSYLDATSPTHAGNLWDWENGNWAYGSVYDLLFEVHADPPATVVTTEYKVTFGE